MADGSRSAVHGGWSGEETGRRCLGGRWRKLGEARIPRRWEELTRTVGGGGKKSRRADTMSPWQQRCREGERE